MADEFDDVKKFLAKLDSADIKFKQHFYLRALERPISEELVREHINKVDLLLKVERQSSKNIAEKKYKLWIKLSSRYMLVLVVAISGKVLYIITAWNTDRKWQKQK